MADESDKKSELGQKLHDGIAQKLTAANMNLMYLSKSLQGVSDDSLGILKESIELINDSIQEAREISHQLLNQND